MAATLRQSYITGDNNDSTIFNPFGRAQTFITTDAYLAVGVNLLAKKIGSPGNGIFSIRATSSGVPTGPDLASFTMDGNSLTGSDAWTTDTFGGLLTFDTPLLLSPTTTYALVWLQPDGDGSNSGVWRDDRDSGSYPGGAMYRTTDGGSSFTISRSGNDDAMFEVWGEDAPIASFVPRISIM